MNLFDIKSYGNNSDYVTRAIKLSAPYNKEETFLRHGDCYTVRTIEVIITQAVGCQSKNMFRDRTNLYLAYRKTFPHHNTKRMAVDKFESLRQEEEGLLGDTYEMQTFHDDNPVEDYTSTIQNIENQGNDLVRRIGDNMKKLGKKYKEVLLPQFDDDIVQRETDAVNDLSNRITDELRMIYKVISELQKLDNTLAQRDVFSYADSRDKGTRTLINNLKKKFAIVSQDLSREFRDMQGKYVRYLKKDEAGKYKDNEDLESYSRNAMAESKQSQMQLQQNGLVDDQEYLLEREREIYKISQNVVELSIIFKELENIVIDQGTILDNIVYNLDRTVENTQGAHKELVKAEGYQKQTRKCKIILFLVLLILLCLMLLMVKPKKVDHYVHDGEKGTYEPVEENVKPGSDDNVIKTDLI